MRADCIKDSVKRNDFSFGKVMSSEVQAGGARPPPAEMPASSTSSTVEKKDFASTHRVKKLLETYTMTAERSLSGPDASDHKFYANASTSGSYKLPPDVELSKTSPSVEANPAAMAAAAAVAAKIDVAATKRLQALAVQGGGLKGGALSPPPPPTATSHPPTHNGLVTLSRYSLRCISQNPAVLVLVVYSLCGGIGTGNSVPVLAAYFPLKWLSASW